MSNTAYNPQGITSDDDDLGIGQEEESKYIGGSPMELLQEALKEDTREPTYPYRIPARKSLRLILDPNIDGEKFQLWQRNSYVGKKRGPEAQIDALKLAGTMVANCTAGIEVLGKDGEWHEATENGQPLTFASKSFRAMLSGGDVVLSGMGLIRKLFGNDGHLLECSGDLATRAGYGAEDLGDPEVGGDADPLGSF